MADIAHLGFAIDTGAIDDGSKALDRFEASAQKVTRAAGLAGHQVNNLRSQFFDIFTSLQGGISPLTVLSQQGPQVYEALAGSRGISAGLRAARESGVALLSRFTPMAGALTGVATAAGVAALAYNRLAESQRQVALGLSGIGRQSGATVGDINRISASAAGGTLSTQSARELSTEFAKTGEIRKDVFADAIKLTKDLAVVMETDVPTAGKFMAQALAEPTKGLDALNKIIGGADGATRRLVESLEATGDKAGAQRALMASFAEATKVGAQNVDALTTAWNSVKAASSNAMDVLGKGAMRLISGGVDLEEQLSHAREVLQNRNRYLGGFGAGSAQKWVDDLEKQIALTKRLREEAERAKPLREGEEALSALTPGRADLLALDAYQAKLTKAFETGRSERGTEEALQRVTAMLKAGGTEAYNLGKAARDAFDQAGMSPFEKRIAQIDAQTRDRLSQANKDPRLVAGAIELSAAQSRAAVREATLEPLRETNVALNEQAANLKVQRDAFMLSAGAAGEMASRQDQINKFMRDGVPITDSLLRSIDAYAKRAGEAAAANEKLQRTQQNIVGGMDDLRSGTSGILTGIFSDRRQGRNPMEGIQNGLGRMADQLFNRTVSQPLTEGLFGLTGKPGGGLFGDMASKIFGDASGIKVPQATINATTVTVNGGISGPGGLTGGGADGGLLSKLGGLGGSATNADVTAYIRAAAAARGIDPDTAVKVAGSEGLKIFDPSRGMNAPGDFRNGTAMSYGPFQLFTGGGLGNIFKSRTGLDPSDPSTWRQQVDFSLDEARRTGWGSWYGAAKVGVGKWDGIGRGRSFSDDDDDGGYAAATDSVGKLSDKIAQLPQTADGLTDSLGKVGDKFLSLGGGGGILDNVIGTLGKFAIKGLSGAFAGGFADGGLIHGAGGPRTDSILARVSNGEYIVNAASTARHRDLLDRVNFGFAGGGAVGEDPRHRYSGSADATATPMQVIINNNHSGASVRAQEKPDGRGGRRLEVIVDEMVAAALSRPGGPAQQVLRQYGVRPPVRQA